MGEGVWSFTLIVRLPWLYLCASLFQKYVFIGLYEKMEQVPKLVQWLISIGASIETIGPYPLHALMRLCIQASEYSPSYVPSFQL